MIFRNNFLPKSSFVGEELTTIMALSVNDISSSLKINSTTKFYKLSMFKKEINLMDDKITLGHFFDKLVDLYCSLCCLSQENGILAICEHLQSESHVENQKLFTNSVGFFIEEMPSLIICNIENMHYFFTLKYAHFPYEIGIGIANDRFITIINYKPSGTLHNSKENFSMASLEDFNVYPVNIREKYRLLLLIGSEKSSVLFKKNVLLYEFFYSTKGKKFTKRTAEIWHYISHNVPKNILIICSCKQQLSFAKFKKHCISHKDESNVGAVIYCHLCKSLSLFEDDQCLLHFHNCANNKQSNIKHKKEVKKLPDSQPQKKQTPKNNCMNIKFIESDQEILKTKMCQSTTYGNNQMFRSSNETDKSKNTEKIPSSLSKLLLGKISNLEPNKLKSLLKNFKVYIYILESGVTNIFSLNELGNHHISSLICCLCVVCYKNYEMLVSHLEAEEHNQKLRNCLSSAILFPDIGTLIICKENGLSTLQHLTIKDKDLFNNITIRNDKSIIITFYNYGKKNKIISNRNNNFQDNINLKLGFENHCNFRLVRFDTSNSSLPPLVFEFFSGQENPELIQQTNINNFLASLKDFKMTCYQYGGIQMDYDSFIHHVLGKKFESRECEVGVLCHKCVTFEIYQYKYIIEHIHMGSEEDKEIYTRNLSESRDDVKQINVVLHEKIVIQEYFGIVNPLYTWDNLNFVGLSNYLKYALPLNSQISEVTFRCACNNWKGLDEILQHMKAADHPKYGVLCDICLVFLVDSRLDVLENHVRETHPEYVEVNSDFCTLQSENHISINLLTEFSCYLLESYISKVANYQHFKKENIIVFCVACVKTFHYNIENFLNHVMFSKHLPQTENHFSAYCNFCKLLLYSNDVREIMNHFNYHCYLMNRRPVEIKNSKQTTLNAPKFFSSTLPTVVFSPLSFHGYHSRSTLSEFQYFHNTELISIFNNLKISNAQKDKTKKIAFNCLHCGLNGFDEYEFIKHFLENEHNLRSGELFVKICDVCGFLLLGISAKSFLGHFEDGNHFLNKINNAIDNIEHHLNTIPDDERLRLGYVTKVSEEVFSTNVSYDKFIFTIFEEYARAQRGLRSLCQSFSVDIRRVLQKTFPNAEIFFFGSRVSGLATAKSDIDVFIEIGTDDLERLIPLFDNIPGLFTVQKILLNARVPILKLEHKNTGMSCDVSCKDAYAVYNTQLIKLYVNLDSRVYRLCASVLEWASMNEIRGYPKFTSYSLTCMVLFFLMQPDISIIPTLKWLQDLHSGKEVFINGWKCSFLDDLKLIRQHFKQRETTFYKLLHDFFKFYAVLRLDTVILFSNTGEVLPNRYLIYSKSPSCYKNIFFDENGSKAIKNVCFKIMDPFQLNVNIVQHIRWNELRLFQTLCVHTLRNLKWAKHFI